VPSRDPTEGIGLAARVILHLSQLKRLGPNDVAGVEYTQQGMVAAFAVRQSSLVKVLKALLAGDVIAVEHRFVGGANRRMQAYHLTSVGAAAARDLRRAEVLTRSPEGAVTGSWLAGEGTGPRTDPAPSPSAAPRARTSAE
jgi:hypothetical protein